MEDIIISKIENEVLPILKEKVYIERKVTKITYAKYKNFTEYRDKEVFISSELLNPVSDEDFEIITEILLFIVQNPESKMTDELLRIPGFNDMLDNIINIA